MEHISEIIDGNFKSGEGAKGPWTLMRVKTDSGKQATIFAPAAVGDEVVLDYNEQYKNYSAKRATPGVVAKAQEASKLDEISQKLDKIISLLNKDDVVIGPDEDLEEAPF